jgi:hypothetical protein
LPAIKDMNMEAEESTVFGAVTRLHTNIEELVHVIVNCEECELAISL